VQASSDGEALVFHDDVLERLTGRAGPISGASAASLGALPLAGAAEGETIPTLAEFLALVAGRAPLLIEIKDQTHALGPGVGPLERRVAELLARYEGPAAVMSFNPHAVAAMAGAAPDLARGLTSCAFDEQEWGIDAARRAHLAALADFDPLGCAFVSHDKTDLANPAVGALKARRVPVLTWTIRAAAEEASARATADNITFEGYRPPVDAAPAAPI
jgi:glycerophosphoryl diester phosphodiesterase